MAGGRTDTEQARLVGELPQWSPGLMAGGSHRAGGCSISTASPQWSPGLMAGGSEGPYSHPRFGGCAAMEPRPDGRGKTSH